MCHGLELLGQRFRGHIDCAVFCEPALCQNTALSNTAGEVMPFSGTIGIVQVFEEE